MPVASSRWRALAPIDHVVVLLSDSVTVFDPATAAGAVLVTGSHGGVSALAHIATLRPNHESPQKDLQKLTADPG